MVKSLFLKNGKLPLIVNFADEMSSAEKGIYYLVPGSTQRVIIMPEVISVFSINRQIGADSPEVGGQLFAYFGDNMVLISMATGPYKEDKKARFHFIPCRKRERKDIKKLFDIGLHFVGDWHTHPQTIPIPSKRDEESIRECFVLSKHELNGFILIIVGTSEFPGGLWVSLHNRNGSIKLQPL